jgi:hypothetical protein
LLIHPHSRPETPFVLSRQPRIFKTGRLSSTTPYRYAMTSLGRRDEAEREFRVAVASLQELLQLNTRPRLRDISFPSFDETSKVDDFATQLDGAIDSLVIAIAQNRKDNDKTSRKVKEVGRKWFRSSYYFVKLVLGVGKIGSAV